MTIRARLAWCIAPITGPDGRPSWSKLVTAAVLAAYWTGAELPADVAFWIIAASHGTKVLMAVIERFSQTVATTASTALSYARTKVDERRQQTTHTISETRKREIREGRDPVEGIDPSDVPETVGAS